MSSRHCSASSTTGAAWRTRLRGSGWPCGCTSSSGQSVSQTSGGLQRGGGGGQRGGLPYCCLLSSSIEAPDRFGWWRRTYYLGVVADDRFKRRFEARWHLTPDGKLQTNSNSSSSSSPWQACTGGSSFLSRLEARIRSELRLADSIETELMQVGGRTPPPERQTACRRPAGRQAGRVRAGWADQRRPSSCCRCCCCCCWCRGASFRVVGG